MMARLAVPLRYRSNLLSLRRSSSPGSLMARNTFLPLYIAFGLSGRIKLMRAVADRKVVSALGVKRGPRMRSLAIVLA